ncbi:small ribosomal subunit protein uS4-like [Ylistrum balloti]|uniref:small ribosomal subunit protein uS4-like n=1 Tax=Ylistrum balloti TaxID=509963 RepID=UPI002905E281|nr:small ribosomal subunit protein uS4-like [Ylistrum balloti]
MARILQAKGKIVRRFGINIFGNPKYDKLLKRKPAPPGELRQRRPRQTEFGRQLLEKQKLKFSYGVSERQLRNIFKKAKVMGGVTGYNLLLLLERRLDNVVYKAGFASSRNQARQFVSHGHILYNNKRVTIPSINVKVGDKIEVIDKKGSVVLIRRWLTENSARAVPEWLKREELNVEVTMYPTRDMIPSVAEEQQIVEFFSK